MADCLISKAQREVNATSAAKRADEKEEMDDVINAYADAIKRATKIWKEPKAQKKHSAFFSNHLCEIESTDDISLGQIIRRLNGETFELKIQFRFDPDSPESIAHVLVFP
jgi:hypothetical protein